MSVIERFKLYLDHKGIANYRAEQECGLSNGLIKNALKGSSIGSDKLENILNTYSDLSAEWLLRGTGDMLVNERMNYEQVFKALNMPSNSDQIIEVWLKFMELTKGMQELYKQSR
jgi:hypothetical protein